MLAGDASQLGDGRRVRRWRERRGKELALSSGIVGIILIAIWVHASGRRFRGCVCLGFDRCRRPVDLRHHGHGEALDLCGHFKSETIEFERLFVRQLIGSNRHLQHADTLLRSEYLPRERERDALGLGADGLPQYRLTKVRDQLVLSSPAGPISPKSPHAYKVGIYSFSARGTTHYECAERQGDLSSGRQLRLVREPSNKFDPNAVAVHAWRGRAPVGYVNKQNAKRLAPLMDAGADIVAVSLRGSGPGVTGLVPYVLAAERGLIEHLLRDTGITLE